MLPDRCLYACLSFLSMTLAYCGQRVGWIKMPLGRKVGLSPGDIVLDGDPAPPPQRGKASNFRPMSIVTKRLDGSRCHLVRSRPRPRRHCVKWGPSSPKGAQPPIFGSCLLWPNGRPSQLLLSSCSNNATNLTA